MKGLLIHAGALGDFILALRVVEALRQPGMAGVTVLGRPEIASIAVECGVVDAVLDLNQGGYHALFTADAPLPLPVRQNLQGISLAVDMLGGPGSVVSERLGELGVCRVVGIDACPRPDWAGHISDQWLHDLADSGITSDPGPPRIRIPDARAREARAAALRSCEPPANLFAVLHPGSGSKYKCWPLDNYVSLAGMLRAKGWACIVLLGPVEVERYSPAEMSLLHAAGPVLHDHSLSGAAALLAAADVYIGNDSGVSHLAAAVGASTVSIFGPTTPGLWKPLGANVMCATPPQGADWPSCNAVAMVVDDIVKAKQA